MNANTYTLITGASGGIGYELAVEAATNKKNLILVARTADSLQRIAKQLTELYKVDVIHYVIDLSDIAGVRILIDKITSEKHSVDTLINNAGFGDFGNFDEADLSKNLKMIDLNIATLTHLTHFFLQEMIRMKSGKILNVASIAAFVPGPGMAVYYASKAYVLSFSEALARELKGTGVSVTALCPGPTETGFAAAAGLGKSLMHRIIKGATSKSVAKAGYKAMLNGKAIETPGFVNKLTAFMPRFTPRFITRNMIYKIHKSH